MNIIEDTTTAQKEFIDKINLSYTFNGEVNVWDRTSFQFGILFGNLRKPFLYHGSAFDYKENKQTLSDSDLLYAYKCIISDAYCIVETENDKSEFLTSFGFIDEPMVAQYDKRYAQEVLSDTEFKQYQEGIKCWNGCKETHKRLNKSDDELAEILNELQDLGID
jgi:hypothetical protein